MDQIIKCSDCKNDFVVTEGEQTFFQNLVAENKIKSFEMPKRCKTCREARKKQRE